MKLLVSFLFFIMLFKASAFVFTLPADGCSEIEKKTTLNLSHAKSVSVSSEKPHKSALKSETSATFSDDFISDRNALEFDKKDHARAIKLARESDFQQSLKILGELHRSFPGDKSVQQDYVAVLSWAERDGEAVSVFDDMCLHHVESYVLEALGKSLRNEQKFEKAVEVYRAALLRFPGHFPFAAGLSYALAESERFKEADKQVERLMLQYPDEVRTLQVAANVERQKGDLMAALYLNQRILDIAPDDNNARRSRILILDKLGASHLALQYAIADSGLLSRKEWLALKSNNAAHHVRWGTMEQPSLQLRYEAADEALNLVQENLSAFDPSEPTDRRFILRARMDKIVALRHRLLMQEAVDEYEILVQEGAAVPDYVLKAAGDAHLYLKQPQKARDIYLQVLESRPEDFDSRLGLTYAYLELNDFQNAYAIIDATYENEPKFLHPGGSDKPVPNADRLYAEITAALARIHGNDPAEAQARLEKLHAAAPYNPDRALERG